MKESEEETWGDVDFEITKETPRVDFKITFCSDLQMKEFPKDNEGPFLWDYQIKQSLVVPGQLPFPLAYQSLFVAPKRIRFIPPEEYPKGSIVSTREGDPGLEAITKGHSLSFTVYMKDQKWLMPLGHALLSGIMFKSYSAVHSGAYRVDSFVYKRTD